MEEGEVKGRRLMGVVAAKAGASVGEEMRDDSEVRTRECRRAVMVTECSLQAERSVARTSGEMSTGLTRVL
jgi:hypothetical protein